MVTIVKRNSDWCLPVKMFQAGVLLLGLCAAATPADAQLMVNYMKSSTGAPLCLAVTNGQIANNSPLITWECNSGDPSQQFYLSANMFHIGSKTGAFCMASYDNPAHAGSRVGVWQCQPGDATQRFNVAPMPISTGLTVSASVSTTALTFTAAPSFW